MNKLLFALIAVGLTFVGCTHKPKSRIEQKTLQWIASVYDNPKDIEIVSIEKTDSVDVIELVNTSIQSTQEVSGVFQVETQKIVDFDKTLSSSQRYVFKEKVAPLFKQFNTGDFGDNLKLALVSKTLLRAVICKMDTTHNVSRSYKIQFIVNGNNQTAYAHDCALMDSVVFSDKHISLFELPDSIQYVLGATNDLMEFANDALPKVHKLKEFNSSHIR